MLAIMFGREVYKLPITRFHPWGQYAEAVNSFKGHTDNDLPASPTAFRTITMICALSAFFVDPWPAAFCRASRFRISRAEERQCRPPPEQYLPYFNKYVLR